MDIIAVGAKAAYEKPPTNGLEESIMREGLAEQIAEQMYRQELIQFVEETAADGAVTCTAFAAVADPWGGSIFDQPQKIRNLEELKKKFKEKKEIF